MKAFPLSLLGDARKWWINDRDGRITTWEELVKKFFRKFYTISCASNYNKMCDDDDEGQVGNEEGLMDEVSSDEEWEEHEYETLPNPAAKPNLDTHYKGDKSNHEKRDVNGSKLGKFPHQNNEPYGELAETMIWYIMKKTCVELIQAF
ncbi:hypothetical protein Tco_0287116 [Tanacetum coccineum]